jgi:hypothetical protein
MKVFLRRKDAPVGAGGQRPADLSFETAGVGGSMPSPALDLLQRNAMKEVVSPPAAA